MTRCAICNLPAHQRVRVDRERITEKVSLGQIAGRVGCNKTSVMRHRDSHLRPAVKEELERIESGQPAEVAAPRKVGERPNIRKGVRAVVEDLFDDCRSWMDRAKDETAWPMAAAFAREARQSAELVGRLNGELARDPQGAQVAIQIVCPAGAQPAAPAPALEPSATIDIALGR